MNQGVPSTTSTRQPPPKAVTAGASTFYRYRTADGRIVIVDSLERVPLADRARVERVELDAAADRVSATAPPLAVDWPSFAGGFGVALAFVALFLAVTRGSTRLLAMFLIAGFAVAGSGAYFGWVRRNSGQGDGIFASPSAIINDARSAVEKMKKQQVEQDRVIRDIQRQAP